MACAAPAWSRRIGTKVRPMALTRTAGPTQRMIVS